MHHRPSQVIDPLLNYIFHNSFITFLDFFSFSALHNWLDSTDSTTASFNWDGTSFLTGDNVHIEMLEPGVVENYRMSQSYRDKLFQESLSVSNCYAGDLIATPWEKDVFIWESWRPSKSARILHHVSSVTGARFGGGKLIIYGEDFVKILVDWEPKG